MAKDSVDRVREAEQQAQQMVNDARSKAAQMIEDAKKRAQRQYDESIKAAAAAADDTIATAKSDGQRLCDEELIRHRAESEQLRKNADKKRTQAVELVLRQITTAK